MKKKLKRLTSRIRKRTMPPESPGRITNETVAEHREQIIAGGRRFKYPVQYTKSHLVRNSILIGVGALLLLLLIMWWQLYLV